MRDAFEDFARYYDPVMAHIDYDRWVVVAAALSALLPRGFSHLDAACGTGVLVSKLRRAGWRSVGVDLSRAMLRAGRKCRETLPAAVADLRALPVAGGVDFITCLFDSLNFLLEPEDLHDALREIGGALRPGGLLYFDAITERMVLDHFDGERWTEQNDRFSTTWESEYCRRSRLSDTYVSINNGPRCLIRERIYDQAEIEAAVRDAGLELLGAHDALTWKTPDRRSIRIDFVAAKDPPAALDRGYRRIAKELRSPIA